MKSGFLFVVTATVVFVVVVFSAVTPAFIPSLAVVVVLVIPQFGFMMVRGSVVDGRWSYFHCLRALPVDRELAHFSLAEQLAATGELSCCFSSSWLVLLLVGEARAHNVSNVVSGKASLSCNGIYSADVCNDSRILLLATLVQLLSSLEGGDSRFDKESLFYFGPGPRWGNRVREHLHVSVNYCIQERPKHGWHFFWTE